ncbi:hypothetical protein G9A89_014939 [Geosiphon pyriformis]|nr:hypothetical protein G9A89_014939 [Geosiphon pyriformis]
MLRLRLLLLYIPSTFAIIVVILFFVYQFPSQQTVSYRYPIPRKSHMECQSHHEKNNVTFEQLWNYPPTRIFVGIYTTAEKLKRRELIRNIYKVAQARLKDDIVDFKFIIGRVKPKDDTPAFRLKLQMEKEAYNDVVMLDIYENINEGKIYEYFRWAGRTFNENNTREQYDYILKIDDDAFLHFQNLALNLRPLTREKLYYGYNVKVSDDFEFMTGMLEVLSIDHVRWISKAHIPQEKIIGPEDAMVAQWLELGGWKFVNWIHEKCLIYQDPRSSEYLWCWRPWASPNTIMIHGMKVDWQWNGNNNNNNGGGGNNGANDGNGGNNGVNSSTNTTTTKNSNEGGNNNNGSSNSNNGGNNNNNGGNNSNSDNNNNGGNNSNSGNNNNSGSSSSSNGDTSNNSNNGNNGNKITNNGGGITVKVVQPYYQTPVLVGQSTNITWEVTSQIPSSPPTVSIQLLRGIDNNSRVISEIDQDILLLTKLYQWIPSDTSLQNATDYTVRVYNDDENTKINAYSQRFIITNLKSTPDSLNNPSNNGNPISNNPTSSTAASPGPKIIDSSANILRHIPAAKLFALYSVVFLTFSII